MLSLFVLINFRRAGNSANAISNVRARILESFLGVNREINIHRFEECGTCHGSGAKPGTNPVKCTVCRRNRTNKTSAIYNIRSSSNYEDMFYMPWNRRSDSRTM